RGKRPLVTQPTAQKAITVIEIHEQRRRMASAHSSRFEELAGEFSSLRVLPADQLCWHRGRDIRVQLLVRCEQDPSMAALYIDRLKTRRMIGFGGNAPQRVGRQCAGNVPIALASADKTVGKHD